MKSFSLLPQVISILTSQLIIHPVLKMIYGNKPPPPFLTKFDVESSQIHQFIEDLRDRAVATGWLNGQENIIDIPDSSGTSRNFIKQYCQLSRQNVQENVVAHLGHNNLQRSQNAQQMYYCIMAQLTES
jgi:hypothetical protein